MKRKNGLVIVVALLSMIGGAALFQLLQPPAPALPVASAPAPVELHAVPLTDLAQLETVFGDWRGEVLLVNFWAPWCAPCRREIPSLLQVRREYAARGLEVLGIAFDGEAQVRRFAEEYSIDYPLFLVRDRAAMYNAAFGNLSGSLPFTALVDRNLRIVYRHNGEMTLQALRALLDDYL